MVLILVLRGALRSSSVIVIAVCPCVRFGGTISLVLRRVRAGIGDLVLRMAAILLGLRGGLVGGRRSTAGSLPSVLDVVRLFFVVII